MQVFEVRTYLVLLRFCLLSALPSESPDASSFAVDMYDWSKPISYSPSRKLNSDPFSCAVSSAGAEELRGGGEVASLIVADIQYAGT